MSRAEDAPAPTCPGECPGFLACTDNAVICQRCGCHKANHDAPAACAGGCGNWCSQHWPAAEPPHEYYYWENRYTPVAATGCVHECSPSEPPCPYCGPDGTCARHLHEKLTKPKGGDAPAATRNRSTVASVASGESAEPQASGSPRAEIRCRGCEAGIPVQECTHAPTGLTLSMHVEHCALALARAVARLDKVERP